MACAVCGFNVSVFPHATHGSPFHPECFFCGTEMSVSEEEASSSVEDFTKKELFERNRTLVALSDMQLAQAKRLHFALTEVETHLVNIKDALTLVEKKSNREDATYWQHELKAFETYAALIRAAAKEKV